MPIPVNCECGRSFRVKDELAGRTAKCPNCHAMLTIPQPEEEDIDFAPEEPEEPARPTRSVKPYSFRREEEERPPMPRPSPASERKPERRKPRRSSRERSSGGSLEANRSVVGGILMMIGALVWFFVGLAGGIIFFYPPILFVIGIGTLVSGLSGGGD